MKSRNVMKASTKAEKRRRRELYRTVLIGGKQVRIKRDPTVEGIPVDEFIRRNADPIWLQQNELYELIQEEDDPDSGISD